MDVGHPPSSGLTLGSVRVEIGLLVALAVTGYRVDWFFPAAMVIVGAHYQPFGFLYGIRLYAAPGRDPRLRWGGPGANAVSVVEARVGSPSVARRKCDLCHPDDHVPERHTRGRRRAPHGFHPR